MDTVYQFFIHIAQNYGSSFAIFFLLIIAILFGMYFLVKTFPDVIRSYLENKLMESKDLHRKGTSKRKNISPNITKILSDLIVESGADRAMLFEFSNGSSNLAGLPFLFINATSESLSVGTPAISWTYQKFNVSLFANFILELEDKSYFYAKHIEETKDLYPSFYAFLQNDNVESVIYYSIYGVDEPIGYISLASVKGKTFERSDTLPKMAEAAQKISSLLNYGDIDEM